MKTKIWYRFSNYIDFLNWINKYKVQFDDLDSIEVSIWADLKA